MRYASRAALAGALGFAAAFVVACGGSSGLLSGNQASNLNGQLDSVSSALASKNCGDVSNATSRLADDVVNLPSSINSTLRNNLTQGVSTIAQLARHQCANVPSTPAPTTPTNTETATTQTHTETTPTTPTNTNTTPTTPTNTTTTPATTTTPSGTTTTGTGGAGLDQGNGNSSGGSGTGGNGNGQ
jgi:hypothetical protein